MKTHRFGQWPRFMLVVLTFAGVEPAFPAAPPHSLSDETLTRIRFEQKLNAQVPLDLPLRDETGATVRLQDYFGKRPVILVLGYYGCPMLCTLALNGLVESLQQLKIDMGKGYEVVNVSIDPTEMPDLAAAKKRTYLRRYGRPGAAQGWHFLTGEQSAIQHLADTVGFRYAYDPSIRQYAHPSGFVVLTPGGKISRYFFGVDFPGKDVAAALREAGADRIGSPIQQLILLCFHYSPLTGKYGPLIMTIVRVSGAFTVLALVAAVVWIARRRRAAAILPAKAEGTASSQTAAETATARSEAPPSP